MAGLSWRRRRRGGVVTGGERHGPSGGAREAAWRDSLQHRQHNTARPARPLCPALLGHASPRPPSSAPRPLAATESRRKPHLSWVYLSPRRRSPWSRRVRSTGCHVQTSRRVYPSSRLNYKLCEMEWESLA